MLEIIGARFLTLEEGITNTDRMRCGIYPVMRCGIYPVVLEQNSRYWYRLMFLRGDRQEGKRKGGKVGVHM